MTIIDFEDFLDETGPTLDTEQVDGWDIPDDDAAEWVFRKLAATEREIERVRERAEREIDRIEQWRSQATGTLDDRADRYRLKLRGYYLRLEEAGKLPANTYKLANGKISRHKGRQSTDFVDEDAFVAWCDANGAQQYVATQVRPLAAVVKDERFKVEQADDGSEAVLVDTTTGERVPGVVVRIGEPTLRITPERAA